MDRSTGTSLAAPAAMTVVEAAVSTLVESTIRDGAVRDLTHDELADVVAAGRRVQARVDAAVLAAIAEVDARGTFVHDGALTTAAWLRARTRATPAEAAATARTAAALRRGLLPGTAVALAAGEISTRQAQTIADGIHTTTTSGGHRGPAPAEAVALIEPEVLDVARQADTRAVASVMTAFAHALDPDAADASAMRRYERRGLTLSSTPDGRTVISGLADESSAAVLVAAIDAAAPLVSGDTRTPAQTRLDALTGICRQWLESPDAPSRGGGGHPHIIVTTDDATLLPDDHVPATTTVGNASGCSGVDGSPGAMLSGIGRISANTARRLACDGELTTVLLAPDGAVAAMRTDRRFFTFAQRRAMIARDGDRCPWPWCDRPATWSDGHHLIWANRGGPTTVDNGALPCPGHHTMCHEGGWTLHRHADGRYTATHRDGRTLGPEAYPPGRHRPGRHRPGRPPPRRE